MVTVPSKMLIVAASVTITGTDWVHALCWGYRYTPVDHPHPKGLPVPAGPASNIIAPVVKFSIKNVHKLTGYT